MFDLTKDICSITDFKRNSAAILSRVVEEKAPAVLTLNGSSSVVVIDVETYQDMLNMLEYAKVLKVAESRIQGIKKGVKCNPIEHTFDKMTRMLKTNKAAINHG